MTRRLAVVAVGLALAVAGCAVGDPQPTADVTETEATLHGNLHSSFAGDTEYWWKYGETTSYGSETTHRTIAIADEDPHAVSEPVTGLTADTSYHFQLCARDEEESPRRTNCSTDRTFKTDPPSDGSLIAFTSDRDLGNDDVFVMDGNGNNAVNLTESPAFEFSPDWSQDRSKIAYVGDDGIHVMDADGSDDQLLPGTGDAFDPDWSPDGDQIAFSRSGGEFSDIWVMDADGSDQAKVTNNVGTDEVDSEPAWSPDGEEIAFTRLLTTEPTPGSVFSIDKVFLVGSGGGTATPLTDENSVAPAWSPDGSKLAFATIRDGDWEIYSMDADGSDETNLTNAPAATDIWPTWSPDGSRIAFATLRDSGGDTNEIFVMDADGSDPVNISNNDNADDTQPVWSTAP